VRVLLLAVNRLVVPFPVYPIGLDYVAAGLQPRHTVERLDLAAAPEGALEARLESFAPQLVGISLRNVDNTEVSEERSFVAEARAVVERVRRGCDAAVVVGGAGYAIFPAELLAALGADFGILGEGERLGPVCDAWEQGLPWQDLPGVVLPGRAPLRPPPWEGRPLRSWDPADPSLTHYLDQGGMLSLQTQRGCPFHCIYCTYPGIEGPRPRRFDAAEVAREAVALQAAGARFLWITDSCFNAQPQHALAVARAFAAAGLSIPWGAFFAPLRPSAGFYEELAAGGCSHVEFGTEALCDEMLASYRKPFASADALAAHAAAVGAGLHVAHYFLLGGPGETAATLAQTLERAAALPRCVAFFFCGLRIYPGTELQRIAAAEGKLAPQADLLAPRYYASDAVSSDEILAAVRAGARQRPWWVVGSGGARVARTLQRMYQRGHSGPLWEKLVP